MLKAKLTAEEFGALDQAVKGYYAGDDDSGYILQVEGVGGLKLEDASGLRSALTKERNEKGDLQKRVEAFGDLDPEAARTAIGKMEEMENWSPDDKVREMIASREKQLGDKHTKEIEKAQTREKLLFREVERSKRDEAAMREIASADGNADLLLPLVTSQTRVVENEGRFDVVVLDVEGNVRITEKQGESGNMTLGEFVGTLKDDSRYSGAFKGTGSSGGGTSGDAYKGGGGGGVRKISAEEAAAGGASVDDIAKGAVVVSG